MAKKKTKKKTPIKATKKPPPQVTPYPQAGKKVTNFEDELDKQIAGDIPQEQKRGPGRPPKQPPPEQPETPQGPQLQEKVIDRMLRIPFSAWAEFAALEDLRLTDREAADLAAATKELLDFYIPNLPIHLVLWSNFAVAAIVTLQPRFTKIKELKKQKAKAAQQQGGPGAAGQGGPAVPYANGANFPTEIKTEKV